MSSSHSVDHDAALELIQTCVVLLRGSIARRSYSAVLTGKASNAQRPNVIYSKDTSSVAVDCTLSRTSGNCRARNVSAPAQCHRDQTSVMPPCARNLAVASPGTIG